MRLPVKIEICPILEATVEIRFETNIPPNAVFGVVYNEFKGKYNKVEDLPLSKTPESVIQRNPGLKYGAHYKITNGNYVLQVGPQMLAIANLSPYIGWNDYSTEIYDCFSKLKQLGIIKKVVRFGIRYINFFELDIFKKIRIKFSYDEELFSNRTTIFRTEVNEGEYIKVFQIANNAIYTINNDKEIKGSFIDIDIVLEKEFPDFFENMEKIINDGHIIEKKQFFSLLEEDFIKTLKPKYE